MSSRLEHEDRAADESASTCRTGTKKSRAPRAVPINERERQAWLFPGSRCHQLTDLVLVLGDRRTTTVPLPHSLTPSSPLSRQTTLFCPPRRRISSPTAPSPQSPTVLCTSKA